MSHKTLIVRGGGFMLLLVVVLAWGHSLSQPLPWELEVLTYLAHLRTPSADARWADITAFGSAVGITLMAAVAVAMWALQRAWLFAGVMLAIAVGSGGLTLWLKGLIVRPRPDVVVHGTVFANSSFPSGHALMSMALAVGIVGLILSSQRWWVRKMGGVLAVGISASIGFSRCYFGVHYPTDVLAGWLVGAAWAWWCLGLIKK